MSKNAAFLLVLLLSFFNAAYGQPATLEKVESAPVVAASSPQDLTEYSISALVPKSAALDEELKKLPEKIDALLASSTMNSEIDAAKAKLLGLRNKLNEIKNSGVYSFDKISEIRSPAKDNLLFVGKIQEKITERIKSIEALRQSWESSKNSWENFKLAANVDPGSVANVMREATGKLKKADKLLEGIESPLVILQKRISAIGTENQDLLSEVDVILTVMKKDLFRRSRPAMFTPRFVNQFDKSLWEEFWVGVASLSLPESSFYSAQGWIFTLQFFGILAFIWLFGSIDLEKATQIKLGFLMERKYSAAVVAGVALFYPLFEDLPNLVRVFLWALMTIGGSRLVAGGVENLLRRKFIYILAGLFMTSQFCYLINLPSPVFRMYVALIGLLGAMACFWRARISKLEKASTAFILAIKAGGLVSLFIFMSQLAGYAGLANHLLEVAIKSVFLLLIVWITDLIFRGFSEAMLDNAYVKKSIIFQNHSAQIVAWVKFLLDLLFCYLALSGLLAVWGVYDSVGEAAKELLTLGVPFQGERITFGIIVTAVALLYSSLFASWLIQCILDEEVYPRKKVEPGVGISINRLIHYAFVIFGIVIALSTIGIGLQNLTVLMGAFGIGIGFGLQNIVNNFASGLILLFERSIKVGDVVQVNGEWGTIKNLGLRATVVATFARSELIVPNSDLVSTTVTNWTLTNRQIRLVLPVGVAYGSDVPLVTSVLNQVAKENTLVMNFPEPIVLFTAFGNSSLDFELRVFTSDIDNILTLKNQLNREVDRLFRENGIEIPFPQNDIHIRTMDEPFKDAVKELVDK